MAKDISVPKVLLPFGITMILFGFVIGIGSTLWHVDSIVEKQIEKEVQLRVQQAKEQLGVIKNHTTTFIKEKKIDTYVDKAKTLAKDKICGKEKDDGSK